MTHVESNDKLYDILKKSNSHSFEKIAKGIQQQTSSDLEIGLSMLDAHETRYTAFENALEKTGKLNHGIINDLRTYKHALSVLKSYLSQSNAIMQTLDAYIYLAYLRTEHNEFIEIAKNIDSE